MSVERPTVSPELIAAMIESTPERVRRRLDSSPNAAASWVWQVSEAAWSVDTEGEIVTLPLGHAEGVEQIACTCLLSPRCFHVLACLTRLEVAIVESPPAGEMEAEGGTTLTRSVSEASEAQRGVKESRQGFASSASYLAAHRASSLTLRVSIGGPADEQTQPAEPASQEDVVEPEEKQRRAARELVNSIAQLLRVGVANAGVVVQSGLLRAIHQCRADGLHRLAALGLRVVAGTSEFRVRAPASDPAQLAEDIADLLETSWHVLGRNAVASFWIGTARRKQLPVRPRKLHGMFAEPIITRSGFSGAAAYFLGEDNRIYTASDVRAGDAQHARDAYLGGIEIGPLIQPAKQLARGLYLGTDLTASQDGRLGRGKGIKIVEQGSSTWQVEAIQERFRRPLPDQWNAVYAQTTVPADARPAGWDFVFLEGRVLGAAGPELVFQPDGDTQPIGLAIENESESLYFRENLRMLSHAPGLRMQVIGRVNLHEPRIVSPLAVAPVEGDTRNDNEPSLEIPRSLAGRICLGFDEIQRHFIAHARASAVALNDQGLRHEHENPLSALRRRWIAAMLSGLVSQRASRTNLLRAELASLNRVGFTTGAALLDALSNERSESAASDIRPSGIDTFLAAAVYLRTCRYELGRSKATLGN